MICSLIRPFALSLSLLCTLTVLSSSAGQALADELVNLGLELPKRSVPDRFSLTKSIPANTAETVAEFDGPGCLRHLGLTLTYPGRGLVMPNRKMVIRIYFDDAKVPQVEAPVGDFFGIMHGQDYYDINSLLLSCKAQSGYNCYFPMPFAKNARIEFVTGPDANHIYLQASWVRYPGQELKEKKRFCARWRRENPTERYGRDFLMLDADGPGRLIGFVYGVRLFDNTDRWSHGGSENIYIDGEGDMPAFVRDIGGEDTFGTSYGGAKHPPETHLVAGMPYYVHEDVGDARVAQRLVGYRFFVHDAIEFQHSLHMRFGCMSNDICAMVYWFQEPPLRPYVKLPEWPKLIPGTELKPSETDLPLPESGSWEVTGVFDTPTEPALATEFPSEQALKAATTRKYSALHGFVDIGHLFRPQQRGVGIHYRGKTALAHAVIDAPRDMQAQFRLAWDDQLVLRVNGGDALDLGRNRAFRPRTVEVPLKLGKNDVWVKLSNTQGTNHGGWVFAFRALTEKGERLLPRAP